MSVSVRWALFRASGCQLSGCGASFEVAGVMVSGPSRYHLSGCGGSDEGICWRVRTPGPSPRRGWGRDVDRGEVGIGGVSSEVGLVPVQWSRAGRDEGGTSAR